MAEVLELWSADVMVEMMVALMVDEWVVLMDGSMVESTASTMVDDLNAQMATLMAEVLEK